MKYFLIKTLAAAALLCTFAAGRANAQCSTNSAPVSDCTDGDLINSFTLAGVTTNTGTVCAGNGYSLNTTQVRTMAAGSTYSWQATAGSSMWSQGMAIWIDLNNNGSFETSEWLASSAQAMSHSGSLTIPGNTAAVNNVRMRVRCKFASTPLNGEACTSFTYGETEDYVVNITANPCPLTISGQPSSTTACAGSTATFAVSSAQATNYQWQVNTSTGFVNISDDATYSGTATNVLSVSNVISSMNNSVYRCIVSDGASCFIISSIAVLTVGTPTVLLSPASQATCVGFNVSFLAAFNNPTSYQWQVNTGSGFTNVTNGATYSGATTSSLQVLSATAAMDGYQYRCVGTRGTCTNATSPALLTVQSNCLFPPYFNSATGGGGNVFPFNNTGRRVQYLYKNSQFAGAASGYITAVYVRATTTGINYNINGLSISMKSTSQNVLTAGPWDSGLTQVLQVPVLSGTVPASKWVKIPLTTPFYYDASANFIIDISVVSVSPGFATHTTNNPVGARRQGLISSAINSVDGVLADFGFDLQTCPNFTTQPAAGQVCAGGTVSFTAATDMQASFQWQVNDGTGYSDITNTVDYTGANTGTLVINNAAASMSGYTYRCVATATACSTESDGAILTVNMATAALSISNVLCNGGSTGSINLSTTGTAPFSYSWSNSATTEDISNLSAGSYQVTVTDANGCTASASATVTEPSAMSGSLSVSPVVTVSGQQPYTIYLGYGPQSVTLTSMVSGGAGGYTYQWTPTTGVASPTSSSTAVSPLTTTNYVLTATDANGCTLALSQEITVVNLVVAGNNGNQRYVCHDGTTIAVNLNAMNAHLGHGDPLGPCPTANKQHFEEDNTAGAGSMHHNISVYPNPTSGSFSVVLGAGVHASVVITDIAGRVVANKTGADIVQFDLHAEASGVYLVTINTGESTHHKKIVLQ